MIHHYFEDEEKEQIEYENYLKEKYKNYDPYSSILSYGQHEWSKNNIYNDKEYNDYKKLL